ncbi:MAG TPA: hypothetical protein VK540_15990 [Polyangiaceae bacterium]|nr:hypothetical protein [Polyangiaceae bacterium]
MKRYSRTVTLVCVTKKTPAIATKAILNDYVRNELMKQWVAEGGNQKELAEAADISPAAITEVKKTGGGLDLDSLEKIAVAIGRTFLNLLCDAYAWYEAPERSRMGALALRCPNRARAEAAFVRLGNPEERVRVWANTIYANLRPEDDPDPEWAIQRLILEKQRDPEGLGMPCPQEWVGWDKVRDDFLRTESLQNLAGPLIGFGRLPTKSERPDPFDVESLVPLVRQFLAEHPRTDDRWTPLYAHWFNEARHIRQAFLPEHEGAKRAPTTNELPQSAIATTQESTPTEETGKPPAPKRKKRDTP